MYQKYLVTGAKDPVGRLVVQMLLSEGCQVRVLVPEDHDSSLLRGMGAEIFQGEIFDRDSLKEFMSVDEPRKSAVIHTEEILSISNNKNMDMRRTNVAGAQNVIDMAMRAKIGRFVYLGSAYSLDPDSAMSGGAVRFDRTKVEGDYAETKAEASAYLMNKISLNKFNASLLLPTFIIGPGFSEDYDMNKILKKYLENKVSTISGGHAFVDVRNVATALVAVCENGEPGGSYILNGEYKSSKDFFSEVSEASGSERVKEMPKWQQSKSMGKLVDTFYRVTKKDNPKEVYALFMNSPESNFESTVDAILPESEVRKVHDSLVDVLSRPGNEVLPDRIPGLEKMAQAAEQAKAKAAAEPVEQKPVKEVKTVSEAVMRRSEEATARAKESGEDARKRAEAAAAARERVRAKIEAAKMKAEQQAQIAEAESKTREEASEASEEPKAAAEEKKEEKPESFITRLSVADMLAEAEAKRKAEKEAAAVQESEKEPEKEVEKESTVEEISEPLTEANEITEPEAVEPIEEPVEETAEKSVDEPSEAETSADNEEAAADEIEEADKVEEETIKEEASEADPFEAESEEAAFDDFAEFAPDVKIPEAEEAADKIEVSEGAAEESLAATVEPEAEEAADSVLEKEEQKEEALDSGIPLWERISADDITEEEIFGEDNF